MARTKSKPNLEALRQQQLDLVKKIKEAEAKAKKEQQEKDEHRKLLAGAVALKELDANPSGAFADALLGMLKHHLTRAADRELFDLPPLPKEPKPAPEPAAKPFLTAPEAEWRKLCRSRGRIKPRRNFRRGFPSPRRDDINNMPAASAARALAINAKS